MAGRSCHCLLSPFTGIGLSRDVQNIHGHKSTEYKFVDNLLLKENMLIYLKTGAPETVWDGGRGKHSKLVIFQGQWSNEQKGQGVEPPEAQGF